jgi:hypothetical protein
VQAVKLTSWFIALSQPPVRVGWYLCRNSGRPEDTSCAHRRYWNGRHWTTNGPGTPRELFGTWTAENQWRGIEGAPV